MKKLYLIRYGEIGTKGKNRDKFEDKLMANIRRSLQQIDESAAVNVYKTYGRLFVTTDLPKEKVIAQLQKVFGIVGVCPTRRTELDVGAVKEAVLAAVKEELAADKPTATFKISAQRSNKKFELDSMELNNQLGAYVLQNLPAGQLEVDVHNPDIKVNVEVRSKYIYVYTQDREGSRGLPVGTTGKAGLLLSGGIDSPVAGWMTMKRGVEVLPIYFHSFPFTSDRAKEKVIDLAEVLAQYQPTMELKVVNFTELQKEINDNCPDKLMTLVMRRLMLQIAEQITENNKGQALVTGESLGQVASQTMDALKVTNQVPKMPIFRPLIGLDKIEIEAKAREIGTYETSIQPYEDCCTVFVPEHPETYPELKEVQEAEEKLEAADLIAEAVETVETIKI